MLSSAYKHPNNLRIICIMRFIRLKCISLSHVFLRLRIPTVVFSFQKYPIACFYNPVLNTLRTEPQSYQIYSLLVPEKAESDRAANGEIIRPKQEQLFHDVNRDYPLPKQE